MSKQAPFLTVEYKVERSDVEYAAECIVDDIYENFASDAIDALGLEFRSFMNEVIDLPEFSEMVTKGVSKYGPDAISDPYDYMNFETVILSPGFRRIREVLEMLEDVLSEIEKEERAQKSNACEAAIETLKAAGFKIVKA